jgi:hypothetical protein
VTDLELAILDVLLDHALALGKKPGCLCCRDFYLLRTPALRARTRAAESIKGAGEEDGEKNAEERKKTGIDPFRCVAVDVSGCISVGCNGVGQKRIDYQRQEHLNRYNQRTTRVTPWDGEDTGLP